MEKSLKKFGWVGGAERGGVGHVGGLIPAPGTDDALQLVLLIPVGLPCLERGRMMSETCFMKLRAQVKLKRRCVAYEILLELNSR